VSGDWANGGVGISSQAPLGANKRLGPMWGGKKGHVGCGAGGSLKGLATGKKKTI